jgi:hypothetical protein
MEPRSRFHHESRARLGRDVGSDPRALATADRHRAWLLLVFVVVALGDVLRLGFFADDFIFLDAVARHPFFEVLLGRHGVWPWYRPLSREMFFAVAHAAGTAGPLVAHAIALITVWFAADALHRVVARRIGPLAASVGVALFVVASLTRFVTGWLSGYQDLLSLALVLQALSLNQRGRNVGAAICAGLAPFAKETGFLVFPLLALDAALDERRALGRREIGAYAIAAVAAGALHLLVRLTWPAHTGEAGVRSSAGEIPRALLGALAPWSRPPGPATVWSWVAAVLVAAIVFVIVTSSTDSRPPHERRLLVFGLAAAALGATPAFVAAFVAHDVLRAHFFFPAFPWIVSLVGWAIARFTPRVALAPVIALACGALVWNGNARPVDLDAPAGWDVGPLDWPEAQRIEARTRRLESQLRTLLVARPESLIVVYTQVPSGAWFQTGDGPATRVALSDPRVSAYAIKDLPASVFQGTRPIALIQYDPVERHGFVLSRPDDPLLLRRALIAILTGNATEARLLSALAARADPGIAFPHYLGAVSSLALGSDAASFARELSTIDPSMVRVIGTADPRGDAALVLALTRPLDPAAHRAAADTLASARLPMLEAMELMVAVRLDSTRAADALRLGRLLATRAPTNARRAFELAAAPGAPSAIADSARVEIARLGPTRRP